jgi:hypothetical protein
VSRALEKIRPIWLEDFFRAGEANRDGKKFGEIGENAWHFSVSDPISRLSGVKYFPSYERSGVLGNFVPKSKILTFNQFLRSKAIF